MVQNVQHYQQNEVAAEHRKCTHILNNTLQIFLEFHNTQNKKYLAT